MRSHVLSKTSALLVIDQQYDFELGGTLAVEGGNEIVPRIAELMKRWSFVVLTQDTHPQGHISFASAYTGKKPFEKLTLREVERHAIQSHFSKEELVQYLQKTPTHKQVLWPDHCIVGTKGWELDAELPLEHMSFLLRKGFRKNCDSYSAFFENDQTSTGLGSFLKERGIRKVCITGLAGDYCVFWTAQDAKKLGFEVYYDPALTRFVNVPKNSKALTLHTLKELHVHIGPFI